MAVNSVKYGSTSIDTNRDFTGAIWSQCPWESIKNGATPGQWFEDDFVMTGNEGVNTSAVAAGLGQWTFYGAAGAGIGDGALEGGVVTMGSNGDQEDATLQSSTGAFRMVTTSTLANNRKLWFECRISRSSIATAKGDFFAGLCTPGLSSFLPVAAHVISTTDDTLSTTPSFFGFHLTSSTGTRGGPTEVAVAFELASGTVNYPTNCTTLMANTGNTVLAADTMVKLGFIFDPDALNATISSATARQTAGNIRKKLIRFFVNGVENPAFLSSDDVNNATSAQAFPTGFMAPTFSIMNTTGSSPPTMAIDWVRVAQLANS